MKTTAKEMLDKRLTIQEGFFKGARITITEAIAKELMEDYAKQQNDNKSELRQCKKDIKEIIKNQMCAAELEQLFKSSLPPAEVATANVQRLANKMVEETLRRTLIDFTGKYFTHIVGDEVIFVDNYLKNREK